MFSIRMAMRQINRVRKLVKNIKPIVYPVSGMLFAYSILSNKSLNKQEKYRLLSNEKNVELVQELQEKFKLDLKYILKLIIENVDCIFETLPTACGLMTDLSNDYRILLRKLISINEESLISDVSDAKLELQDELQTKKEQIKIIMKSINGVSSLFDDIKTFNTLYSADGLRIPRYCEKEINEIIEKAKEEDKNNSKLERTYSHVKEQCVRKKIRLMIQALPKSTTKSNSSRFSIFEF